MGEHPEPNAQDKGRKDAAAQHVAASDTAPEAFPPVDRDDSIESFTPKPAEARTFDVETARAEPGEADADSSAAVGHDHTGDGADPAEGKR